jgi:hypothetical protein
MTTRSDKERIINSPSVIWQVFIDDDERQRELAVFVTNLNSILKEYNRILKKDYSISEYMKEENHGRCGVHKSFD